MKIPVVKEHGSWVVFIFSSVAGIAAGLKVNSRHMDIDFFFVPILTIVGLAFLINSKAPLASVFRTKTEKKAYLTWFAFFSVSGTLLLIPFLYNGLKTFIVFLPLVLGYLILLSLEMEHNIFVELLGFAILALSAPIVYFAVTGAMSYRLYFVVFIFFAAGVFKVRMRIKKDLKYRLLMGFYSIASLFVFFLLNMPLVVLAPFSENIVSAIRMSDLKLRTIGNIELIKGLIFTALLIFFWR
ncbi:MAG: YwiC-like family protein [Nitrospirae bacterium]|nr:YwiC-like family protein [Nitrospirota bacterium]